MEDMILCDSTGKKKKIIRNIISFDCNIGRYAYADNDFTLKIPFNKDDIFDIGDWICYGTTEFCGRISSYEIDVYERTSTYRGSSLRGILAHIAAWSWGSITGSMADVMNGCIGDTSINSWADEYIIASNKSRSTSFTTNKSTYNSLGVAMLLDQHDMFIESASSSFSVPQKSHFTYKDGKIYIEFLDADTFVYDSSKVKVKYAVNENTANCITMTKKGNGTESPSLIYMAVLKSDGTVTNDKTAWIIDEEHALNEISMVTECTAESGTGAIPKEASDNLLKAQQQPSVEVELMTEEAEIDDVIVASIAELGLKVTRKVVAETLKIENDIPKITYELEA